MREGLAFFSDKIVGNIFVRYLVSVVVIVIVMASATINLVSTGLFTCLFINLFVYLFVCFRVLVVKLEVWNSEKLWYILFTVSCLFTLFLVC